MNIDKVLIIGPAWVGDMVMAQSLYKALLLNSTPAEIHVVAPAWSRPLLSRMPEIKNVFELDIAHGELGLKKRLRLGRELRKEKYTHAIILPRSFKSALVPWLARVPCRVGDKGEYRYGLLTKVLPSNRGKAVPNVCNYLRYIDIVTDVAQVKREYSPSLTVDVSNQKRILESYNIKPDSPILACMVGAEYGPSKQWPAEHFAELIDLSGQQGMQICLLGSEKDIPASQEIERLSRCSVFNLCGKTSLTDVIDVLAACNVAVSNDSGLMHIAAAVDVPVVAMYGGTTPAYTPPLHSQAKTFFLKLECSPCWQRSCQYDHYRCLKDILPQAVFKAVLARL